MRRITRITGLSGIPDRATLKRMEGELKRRVCAVKCGKKIYLLIGCKMRKEANKNSHG